MSADPLTAIVSALQKEQIIPDVVPASLAFNPTVIFSVVYPNGAEVNLGNDMTVEETQDEPEIRLAAMNGPWDDQPEASYTLAMLDPDAPYRTDAIYRSFRHWVVRAVILDVYTWAVVLRRVGMGLQITGLKAPAVTSNSAEALNALKTHPSTTPYRPPGPRPNSGIHRYSAF